MFEFIINDCFVCVNPIEHIIIKDKLREVVIKTACNLDGKWSGGYDYDYKVGNISHWCSSNCPVSFNQEFTQLFDDEISALQMASNNLIQRIKSHGNHADNKSIGAIINYLSIKIKENLMPKQKTTKATIQNLQVKHVFSEDELRELGGKLADEEFNLASAEMEKAQAVSNHNALIKTINGNITKLATAIKDGFEMREVECTVRMNDPKEGKKTITRKDNGQSFVENMTEDDFDLFM